MDLGQRLRKRRVALGLTQKQLADSLGVTSQHISAIEQGKSAPSLTFLAKLGEEMGTSTDYMITGKEGIITDTIPAIKADKNLSLASKKALITLVEALYQGKDQLGT